MSRTAETQHTFFSNDVFHTGLVSRSGPLPNLQDESHDLRFTEEFQRVCGTEAGTFRKLTNGTRKNFDLT